MTVLQKITAEAKKLRKANPAKFAKWTDAVKAASLKYKKKSPVKKAAHKKKVGTAKKVKKITIKLGGVKTASKTHTDKNKITANIQIGSIKTYKIGDIYADLMNKLKTAMFAQSNIEGEISWMREEIRHNPKRKNELLPKIHIYKKKLSEARNISSKLRSAINKKF